MQQFRTLRPIRQGMLKVSVITLTFNRPVTLQRLLESLSTQTLDSSQFELVLVDVSDSPVDALVSEYADLLNINHVATANRGVAGNRNVGARHARAPLMAFIDDDCIAHSDWLERLLEAAGHFPGALIGGDVENMHPENAVSCAGQVITEAVDRCFNPPGEQATFFPGLNVLIPRQRFLDIGGNDEAFGRLAAEDREFADRWLESGFPLVRYPGAVVIHEHRTDLRGYLRQYFNYGRGAWRYHRERRQRGSSEAGDKARLHVGLRRYIRESMQALDAGMRTKVWFLLIAWEISNAAGYAWQALRDTLGRGNPHPGK